MMRAAVEGLEEGSIGTRPLLIAVTVLTSINEQMLKDELLVTTPLADTVNQYAQNAKNAGLDGVVCSPLEAGMIKEVCGKSFLTVTPGIRYPGSADDQQRVMTPNEAKKIGSDYIVMGRPITAADDPVAAYRKAVSEFLEE
jgi:orotidine-5'-phosphate decarboxylase